MSVDAPVSIIVLITTPFISTLISGTLILAGSCPSVNMYLASLLLPFSSSGAVETRLISGLQFDAVRFCPSFYFNIDFRHSRFGWLLPKCKYVLVITAAFFFFFGCCRNETFLSKFVFTLTMYRCCFQARSQDFLKGGYVDV